MVTTTGVLVASRGWDVVRRSIRHRTVAAPTKGDPVRHAGRAKAERCKDKASLGSSGAAPGPVNKGPEDDSLVQHSAGDRTCQKRGAARGGLWEKRSRGLGLTGSPRRPRFEKP